MKMNDLKEYFGLTGKDMITGFTGVITGACCYISGCDQLLLAPKMDASGACKDGVWFDSSRIEIIETEERIVLPKHMVEDAAFIEWANKYFTNPLHFRRPIAVQELVISYLEHRGEEVTKISIGNNREDVINKMKLYCMNLHYSMNPSITFRGDNSSKYPRHYAWVTQLERDRPANKPREKKHVHCCLFYLMGDEPKELKEIMTCPEVDEEKMEEARREEED